MHTRSLPWFRTVLALAAWVLFFVWWFRVSRPSWTAPGEMRFALALIIAIGVALIFFSRFWIAHNMRLARKGRRGNVSRLVFGDVKTDFLKRAIITEFDRQEGPALMTVSLSEAGKVFRAQYHAVEG